MTLQRDGRDGPYVVECDKCHETIELEADNFNEARQEMNRWGYVAIYIDGKSWDHNCKDCKPWKSAPEDENEY